jgi:hypothetical protein
VREVKEIRNPEGNKDQSDFWVIIIPITIFGIGIILYHYG